MRAIGFSTRISIATTYNPAPAVSRAQSIRPAMACTCKKANAVGQVGALRVASITAATAADMAARSAQGEVKPQLLLRERNCALMLVTHDLLSRPT